MKSVSAVVLVSLASVNGFSVSSSFTGSSVGVQSSNAPGMTMEYIRKFGNVDSESTRYDTIR